MRHIILTGSSSGLGKCLSQICSNYGNIVHMLQREKKENNFNTFYYSTDLAYPEESISTIKEVLKNISHSQDKLLDVIFINCASTINPIDSIVNLEHKDVEYAMKVNIQSPINIILEILKYCDKTNCNLKIINITSGVVNSTIAGWSCYSMCKSAIFNFLDTLSKENNLLNIVSVDPGVMDTNMQETIRNSNEANFPQLQKFISYKRSKTLRLPQEVAQVIYSSYIDNWYATDYFEKISKYIVN